ncbi:MAG: CBS domain-containing protein [Azovibrio sp.]|uniref:CBS domain-containing protein n=1 Tax=Azovibrio sp. TaxID=1872673 RepID=UPI003C773637
MQVREILRVKGASLYTASSEQSLASAVDLMARLDAGSLVVMEGEKMAGMLTFREVLAAIAAHGGSTDGLEVGEVMVRDPVTVAPTVEANDLRRLMIEKHMRYLPVTDGEQLLGVISFLDVAKAVLEEQGFENKMLKSYIKNWPEGTATA